MRKLKRITTPAELRKEVEAGNSEYYILLAGGAIRSSKYITYEPSSKRFSVLNLSDDSRQSFTERTIGDEKSERTNIGKAMKLGAFIRE